MAVKNHTITETPPVKYKDRDQSRVAPQNRSCTWWPPMKRTKRQGAKPDTGKPGVPKLWR